MAVELDDIVRTARARKAQGRWRAFAATVPASLLVGIVFFGTLTSVELIRWYTVTRPMFALVIAGIVLIRTLRRLWLKRWQGVGGPPKQALDAIERAVFRFLYVAWSFAAVVALLGLVLFLLGAPRMYPIAFEAIAVTYFMLYYPRRAFFDQLLWYPTNP